MPRPRRPGAPEPKRRSRNGCWPCKNRKIKCGEEKPSCLNCRRQKEKCDYSLKLNWDGRSKRRPSTESTSPMSSTGSTHVFSFALSPFPVQQTTSCGPESSSSETTGNDHFRDTGVPKTVSPSPAHDKELLDRQPSLDVQSFDQSAWTPGELPMEIDNLLQIHNPTLPWPEQSLHLGTAVQDVFPPLPSTQDKSYPSPAETASEMSHGNGAFSLDDHIFSKPAQDMPLASEVQNNHVSNALASSSYNVPTSSVPIDFLLDKPEDHRSSDGLVNLSTSEGRWHMYLNSATDNYGLDCGRKDLDLNKNDDHAAIDVRHALGLIGLQCKPQGSFRSSEKNDPVQEGSPGATRYIYYSSPVPVDIPRYLSPLPSTLLKNPINLMYFHHFINHTARMLVPHDCENNPFVSVLPSMAVADSNLLNLTLAYSASHRARYLGHPQPANRIADWVRDVFPTLRFALDDPHASITDCHLATAVMLLSLKIISPTTFEVPIPWQSHLSLARDLFLAHLENMMYSANRIGAFLARWLGYIDIMGALSCRSSDPPLDAYYLVISACSERGEHDELSVDCFTGFSHRTGAALIELGKLVHQCDNERIDQTGHIQSHWKPPVNAVLDAEALVTEFETLRTQTHVNHKHYRDASPTDLVAMDQAFCCSALLHLQCRVLNRPSSSTAVHGALDGLVKAMAQVESGGSAEVGALFPLFTAGCEAQDPQQRMEVLERLMALEKTGMKQVQNARRLMQRCWDEDMPWIALATGEFLG